MRHGRPGFIGDAVQMRYPAGESLGPASRTAWMRTSPLLPGETPSPFQRICPLADCGNAFGRHREPDEMGFVNADLTVALHRDPVGEWVGSQAVGYGNPTASGSPTRCCSTTVVRSGGPCRRWSCARPAPTAPDQEPGGEAEVGGREQRAVGDPGGVGQRRARAATVDDQCDQHRLGAERSHHLDRLHQRCARG